MTVWEFQLQYADGTVVAQTVVAEAATEPDAFASAQACVNAIPRVRCARPGKAAPPDIEARWREVLRDVFPDVVSDAGRLALYARGDAVGPSRD